MAKKTQKKSEIVIAGIILTVMFSCGQISAQEDPSVVTQSSSKFIERITRKNHCLGLISLDEQTLREKFSYQYRNEKESSKKAD